MSAKTKSDYKRPTPVKKAYNIVDYGAVSDGKTLNTIAIQTAIDVASKNK